MLCAVKRAAKIRCTQSRRRRIPVRVAEQKASRRTRTLHGKFDGWIIQLDEDPGVANGQEVGIQMTVVPPTPRPHTRMSEGLAKVYEILVRETSGFTDAARHNEHQPRLPGIHK
jgi:hypothetical protein